MTDNPFERIMKVKALQSAEEIQTLKDYIKDLEDALVEFSGMMNDLEYRIMGLETKTELVE